jgi:NTE family protein
MSNDLDHPPRLGLALSGGTAKVIAHLGVLRALEEAGLRPDRLAGTSGGSLLAVLYSSGLSLDDLMDHANDVNWRKLANVHLPRLGLLSSQRIEDFVRDLLGELRFEDLRIPTKVVATNLLTGQKTVFSRGPIAPIIRASCSIPQIFAPVEIDGGLYSDGGIIEYLPLETLLEYGCRVNVGVHLGAYPDFSQPPRHLLGMIMRVIGVVALRNARYSAPLADVLIRPDMHEFSGFDLNRAEAMIEVGYEATRAQIPLLRELLEQQESLWRRLRGWIRPDRRKRISEPT